MTSPPGGGSCTRPKRASIGPASRIDARMRAQSCGSSSRGVAVRAAPVTASGADHSAATRLSWLRRAAPHGVDAVLATGVPLVLLGLVLGPGIGMLDRPALRALAPLTALAVGWLGAGLGARLEWRLITRIPRATWLLCGAQAVAGPLALGTRALLLS